MKTTLTTTKEIVRKFNDRLDNSMLIIRLRDYKVFSLNVVLAETLYEIFNEISKTNTQNGVEDKAVNSSLHLLKRWKETCDNVVCACYGDESQEVFDNSITMLNDKKITGKLFVEALESINQSFEITQFDNSVPTIFNFGDDDFLVISPRIMNDFLKEKFLEVATEKTDRFCY